MNYKKITGGMVAERNFQNWLVARNAYARANEKDGYRAIGEEAGRVEYENVTHALLAVANSRDPQHNERVAELKGKFGGASIDGVVNMAGSLYSKLNAISENAQKAGSSVSEAKAIAMNSFFGSPGFDQFGNLNMLISQLYQGLTFVDSFNAEGDAVQLTPEVAASAKAISRFRVPRVEISGAAKTRQGDLNPLLSERSYSNNAAQISLLSEFKDANTQEQIFILDDEQQQAVLGYGRSIQPALAGFILQNQLMRGVDKQLAQAAEIKFVDGWRESKYTDGEGGNYGLLSPAIMLALADAGDASPALASGSDWAENPNTLIQQIVNFNYKPADRTKPIPSNASVTQLYAEIVRLINLPVQMNVLTSGKLVLYMGTSFYAALVNYLGTGTFNRNLADALKLATGGTVQNIEIKLSSLLDARINSYGSQQVNHVLAVVHGASSDEKAILAPFATATPRLTTGLVSEQRSTFASSWTLGGPMITQRGFVFDLAFSVQA